MPADRNYWFPAKRYGWGWGFPSVWQGWLVLAAFVALIVAGILLFPLAEAPGRFVAYIIALCVALVFVGWLKGEPPRWRWGND